MIKEIKLWGDSVHLIPGEKRIGRRKVHRRYSDNAERPDLQVLMLCNNISGPKSSVLITDDPAEVTCGRCKRIMAL